MTQVKKGQFIILDPTTVENKPLSGQGGKKVGTGSPTELETPPDEVDTPEFDPNAKIGPGYERTLTGKAGPSLKICMRASQSSRNMEWWPIYHIGTAFQLLSLAICN